MIQKIKIYSLTFLIAIFLINCTVPKNITIKIKEKPIQTIIKQEPIKIIEKAGVDWKLQIPDIICMSEKDHQIYVLSKDNIYIVSENGKISKGVAISYSKDLTLVLGKFLWDRNDLICTFRINGTGHISSSCYDISTGNLKYKFEKNYINIDHVTSQYIIDESNPGRRTFRCFSRFNGKELWETYIVEADILSVVYFDPFVIFSYGYEYDDLTELYSIHLTSINMDNGKVSDNIIPFQSISRYPDQVTRLTRKDNILYFSCLEKEQTQIAKFSISSEGKFRELDRFTLSNQTSPYPITYPNTYVNKLLLVKQNLFALSTPASVKGGISYKNYDHSLYKFSLDPIIKLEEKTHWSFDPNVDSVFEKFSLSSDAQNPLYISYFNFDTDKNGNPLDSKIFQIFDLPNFKEIKQLTFTDVENHQLLNDCLLVEQYSKQEKTISLTAINPDGSTKLLLKLPNIQNLQRRDYVGYQEEMKEMQPINIFQLSEYEALLIINYTEIIKINFE